MTYQERQMDFEQGTVQAADRHDPKADAEALHMTMAGKSKDKDKEIMLLLTQRSTEQRQRIAQQYKLLYGKELAEALKKELKGELEELMVALLDSPARYDAIQLKKAMKGLGTKESVLIEILGTRTNAQIRDIKQEYKTLHGKELEHDVKKDTSGDFKHILVALCQANRDESDRTDIRKAQQDAEALYKAGEKKFGTDESLFNKIISSQSYAQLRMLFAAYGKVSGHDLEVGIQKEFSGDIRDTLLTIIKFAKNRHAYFAERLHKSMKGLGTHDSDLIRLIVSRCEIDMVQIKAEFYRLYSKHLGEMIKGDCSGTYRDGLLSLIDAD